MGSAGKALASSGPAGSATASMGRPAAMRPTMGMPEAAAASFERADFELAEPPSGSAEDPSGETRQRIPRLFPLRETRPSRSSARRCLRTVAGALSPTRAPSSRTVGFSFFPMRWRRASRTCRCLSVGAISFSSLHLRASLPGVTSEHHCRTSGARALKALLRAAANACSPHISPYSEHLFARQGGF